MSRVMTVHQMKKEEQEVLTTDSDVVPIRKKELMARLEGEEMRYQQCYEECVKLAAEAKASKQQAKLFEGVLVEVKKQKDLLSNELQIYKSKSSKTAKEIENHKIQIKTANDFNKDVDDAFAKNYKEQMEKMRKEVIEKYLK
jgi:chromosome segregation ATPase